MPMHYAPRKTAGFTLVEVLVVITIIAILAGILLVALSGVQDAAKRTKTESVMQSFARACDVFALDHGRYPGLLPDGALGSDNATVTPTQNALLELMGGARVRSDNSSLSTSEEFDEFAAGANETVSGIDDPTTGLTWELTFDVDRFGEGPWIDGRSFEPYFSPGSSDLIFALAGDGTVDQWPTIIDAWESEILYLRASRGSGPLMDVPDDDTTTALPQFDLPDLEIFFTGSPLNVANSLIGPDDNDDRVAWLSLLLAHPSFWDGTTAWQGGVAANVAWSTARGRYMLLSAGKDTIFLEQHNAPGADSGMGTIDPVTDEVTPAMMTTFDDVIVHGGG